jgi:hypothetical protein
MRHVSVTSCKMLPTYLYTYVTVSVTVKVKVNLSLWTPLKSDSINTLILNFDSRRKWVVSFGTEPLCLKQPLNMRLVGFQSQYGRSGEHNNLLSLLGIEHDSSIPHSVTREIYTFPSNMKFCCWCRHTFASSAWGKCFVSTFQRSIWLHLTVNLIMLNAYL